MKRLMSLLPLTIGVAFWQFIHRAATAEGVRVAFVDTWAGVYGCLPETPASEADEKAFAARSQVFLEGDGNGFRKQQGGQ